MEPTFHSLWGIGVMAASVAWTYRVKVRVFGTPYHYILFSPTISMGIYIDPKTCSKETWLQKNAEPIRPGIGNYKYEECPVDCLPVVLMFNNYFNAAGIAYNRSEFDAMARNDGRVKMLYIVKREKLNKVTEGYYGKEILL